MYINNIDHVDETIILPRHFTAHIQTIYYNPINRFYMVGSVKNYRTLADYFIPTIHIHTVLRIF